MGVLETGIDIVEIQRVATLVRRYGERFRARVYTDREWGDCDGKMESLAARFAAKEATIKALGSREAPLHQIEIVRPSDSRPRIRLRGRAAEVARSQGVRELSVSLAHGQDHAIAVVVVLRDGEMSPHWDAQTE